MNATVIIIPEPYAAACNALALANFDPVGGLLTFVNPLVTPPDLTAITHRWCCAPFSPEKRALLDQLAPSIPGILIEDYDLDLEPGGPFRILAEVGLAVYIDPLSAAL